MCYDCKICDCVFRAKLNAYLIYYCSPAESVFDLHAMGAPKQKWTAEEEQALKAGVVKHGVGKWRTILKDPEFSSVLYLRSNVDLKVWLPCWLHLLMFYFVEVHYFIFLTL